MGEIFHLLHIPNYPLSGDGIVIHAAGLNPRTHPSAMDVLDMADDDDFVSDTTLFNLCDAPDTSIGEPEEIIKAGQTFQIQLAQDLVREMQQHTQSNKGVHLHLGKTPVSRTCTSLIEIIADLVALDASLWNEIEIIKYYTFCI